MIVYRITRKKYATDLSGSGAAVYGGRWNKKGTPVLYTGGNIEIALLETIVHIPTMLVPELVLLTLEFPDHSITEIKISELPKNWVNYPAHTVLSEIAQKWVDKNETIALKVPSCIIHSSCNYILNCSHPDFNLLRLVNHEEFHFDTRLKK